MIGAGRTHKAWRKFCIYLPPGGVLELPLATRPTLSQRGAGWWVELEDWGGADSQGLEICFAYTSFQVFPFVVLGAHGMMKEQSGKHCRGREIEGDVANTEILVLSR